MQFLNYLQVISAILKHLLGKARQQAPDKSRFSYDTNEFWISPTIVLDLAKFKCKDYYWMFIRKTERDLETNDLNWDDIFVKSMDICNDHKLKEFNYKLIHRTIAKKGVVSLRDRSQ